MGESGVVYRQMILGSIRVAPERIRCPLLCMGGTADRIVSRRLLRLTARRLSATLREYPGKGHWLIAEPGFEALVADAAVWLENQRPESEVGAPLESGPESLHP